MTNVSQMEGATPREQARSAWAQHDLWTAKRHIEAAFEQGPTGEELARVNLTAGVIYREIGDLHLAHQYLEAVRTGWEDYPGLRPILEGYVVYNLGLVYYQRRQYAESALCNELAAAEFRREGMTDHQRRALQNLAWIYCELRRVDEATETLESIHQQHLIDATDADAHHRQRLTQAYCCLLDDDVPKTIAIADELIQAEVAPDVQAYAYWLAGHAAVEVADLAGADTMAGLALAAAMKANDAKCMSDISRLRQRIAQAKQQQGA